MAAMTRTLGFNQTLLNNINVIKQYEKTLLMFLCLLCTHICRRVSSIWAINICMYVCMYVCMYTRILISDFSVFRTFTSMPINGLNIKFWASDFRFRIHVVLLTLLRRNFYRKINGRFLHIFFSIKVR